jgi:uncharacterized phage protein (TIGR02216 family)
MRLAPKDFWGMTPVELAHALGLRRPPAEAPGRGALAALMRAFPDTED